MVGAAEIAVLLGKIFPDLKFSQEIMQYLMFGGDSTRITISLPSVLGIGLVVLGATLRLSCYRTLGKLFTYEVVVQKKHMLVTSGPYSIVR